MDDPMVIAGAIVLVIASVGGAIVQIINAKASADERKEAKNSRARLLELAQTGDEKNNEIIKQGVAIESSTNSNLAKVSTRLEIALTKIDALEKAALERAKNREDSNIIENPIPLPIPIKIIEEPPVKDKKDKR